MKGHKNNAKTNSGMGFGQRAKLGFVMRERKPLDADLKQKTDCLVTCLKILDKRSSVVTTFYAHHDVFWAIWHHQECSNGMGSLEIGLLYLDILLKLP